MKVILSINTANNKEITVGVIIDGKDHVLQQSLDTRKAQVVLPLVEKLLQKNKLSLQDITEIQVNPGPGSFTGLRVGVAIANTLGFLLTVPINGKKVGEFVEPAYN